MAQTKRAQARALLRQQQMPSLGISDKSQARQSEEDRVLDVALQAMAEAAEQAEQSAASKHATPVRKKQASNTFVPHVLLHTNCVLPSARGW